MKSLLFRKLPYFLAIFIPAIIGFRWLFISHSLSWGDAPYFSSEGLKELFSEPYVWTSRNLALGGPNLLLWLSPHMFLYGLLGKFLSNDNILRFLFFFPSIILAGLSPYLLTRHLKHSNIIGFFTSLLYLFNTYFILLIDGGQVGVALAYSLFPLSLLFYRKLLDENNNKNFFSSLLFGSVLFATDPRLGIISTVVFIFWSLIERKSLRSFPLNILGISLLSLYWLLPLIKMNSGLMVSQNVNDNFLDLLHPLFLFSTHWPVNEFGRVLNPPFYFVLIPILILLGLLAKPKKENFTYTLCFLLFAFLAKGTSAPLGEFYGYLAQKIPFGQALRDSSKFFAPTILFAGILIGKTMEVVGKTWFKVLTYGFLIFSIYPLFTGSLNFVLSSRNHPGDVQIISQRISETEEFTRAAWFPEKDPTAFHTDDKQAIDAKDLINLRPLQRLNVGSYDLFNYMHNPEFLSWYKFFGLNYLVLGENPRIKDLSQEELINNRDLNDLVATISGLIRQDWTEKIPVYRVAGSYPRLFTAEKALGVIGSDLSVTPDKGLPIIYFEDGKFDPADLQGLSQDSLKLVFNKKGMDDFRFTFLQKHFVSPQKSLNNQWAVFGPEEYLKYKFELLIRDYKFDDFDYGKGIAFSTQKGEKIEFKINVSEKGKYILSTRSSNAQNQNFLWKTKELNLEKGVYNHTIVNETGFEVLNTVALIPNTDWERAKTLSENFISHFGSLKSDEALELPSTLWGRADFINKSPVSYEIKAPQNGYWVIFIDSYNSEWKLRKGIQYLPSLPIFSSVNGFYVDPKWNDLEILFWGQRYLRWGIYYSSIAALSLAVIFLWNYKKG